MTSISTSEGRVGKIRCKGCDKVWNSFGEYMNGSGCDKETCTMGKRWKTRNAANQAIEKAMQSSREEVYVCHVKTCHMEDQHDESKPYRERPLSHCISFHVMKR